MMTTLDQRLAAFLRLLEKAANAPERFVENYFEIAEEQARHLEAGGLR